MKLSRSRVLWLTLLLAALPSCAASYLYGPVDGAAAQPRDDDCAFTVTDTIPQVPFDTLGVLAPEDIQASRLSTDPTKFQKAVEEQVCEAGGDAVVVERDAEGRFVRGTVIKLK